MDIDSVLDAINYYSNETFLKMGEYCKNTNKTQWMIDILCDAVVEGQPKAWVWGHTQDYAVNELQPRVIDALKKRGLTVKQIRNDRIEVDGSIIIFSGVHGINKRRGCRGFGDFVDHHAYECGDLI